MSPVPDPSQNHERNGFHDGIYEIQGPGFIAPGSSSEEDDISTSEYADYQPLPQGPDNFEEETINYNSLEGLLSALNTHGPNEINVDCNGEQNSLANGQHQECLENNDNILVAEHSEGHTGAGVSAGTTVDSMFQDSKTQRKKEEVAEQKRLWNSKNGNEIVIDETKEEEIKTVMLKITLPNSAIPPWAKELSEEDWKTQISSRIFGRKSSRDET